MRNVNAIAMSLLLALGLSSCATPELPPAPPSVIEVKPPRLAQPPAEVMQPREANFRERLLNFFCPSCTTPTTSSASSELPSR